MTEYKNSFPDFYITTPLPCPYLKGRYERKLFTHLTADKPAHMVDELLTGGFRRSQNIAYMPYCDKCTACISIRILAHEFQTSPAFKRVKKANRDLRQEHVEPVASSEQYNLFRDYIEFRHAESAMAEMSVMDYAMMLEDSVIDTFITEYRLRDPDAPTDEDAPLIAAALCDQLSDGISMVYSFFDPTLKKRSLGTYMILDHIDQAVKMGLPYVYLGYWIAGSQKMAYKAKFQPQEHLTQTGWRRP